MIFTLKDFKIKAEEIRLLFPEDFVINNSSLIQSNTNVSNYYKNTEKDFYNSYFDVIFSTKSKDDIAKIQNLYTHEQLLFYFRNDIPSNRKEIVNLHYDSFYNNHTINQSMEELFLVHDNLNFEQFDNYYLSAWLNNFNLNETSLQFFKRLSLMPSKEEYYTHLVTKEILINISRSPWAIGCEKTHLSDYEKELIKKYSVLKDLNLMQISLKDYHYRWVYTQQAGFNQIKSTFKKRFNYINDTYYKIIAQI